MGDKRRVYTDVEREQAVAHARDVGQYRAAADLGISVSTINRWVKEQTAPPPPTLVMLPSPILPDDAPTDQLEGIVLAAGRQIVSLLESGAMNAADLVRLWTAAFDRWHAYQTATVVVPSPVDLDDSDVDLVVDELLARAV